MKTLRKGGKYIDDYLKSNKTKIYHFKITRPIRHINANKCLEKVRKMREAKATFVFALSINSPYGHLTQAKKLSDAFIQTSSDLQAPLYTFAEDFALESGYYLLSSGHKVFANPYSLVGDVGLRVRQLRFGNFLEKWGVKYETIANHAASKRTSMLTDPNEEERKWLNDVLNDVYEEIATKILTSRRVVFERLQLNEADIRKELLNGRIYTAQEALENGIVDEISTFEEFREKYYKDLKLVEHVIDKNDSIKLRSLGTAVGNWMSIFSQEEKEVDIWPFSNEKPTNEKIELTEKVTELLNSQEFMDKLEKLISTEILDQYYGAISQRATSYEIRNIVEDAVRGDSYTSVSNNSLKF